MQTHTQTHTHTHTHTHTQTHLHILWCLRWTCLFLYFCLQMSVSPNYSGRIYTIELKIGILYHRNNISWNVDFSKSVSVDVTLCWESIVGLHFWDCCSVFIIIFHKFSWWLFTFMNYLINIDKQEVYLAKNIIEGYNSRKPFSHCQQYLNFPRIYVLPLLNEDF